MSIASYVRRRSRRDTASGGAPVTQHTLTVTSSGTGYGTITSTPAGIAATVTAGVLSGTMAALFDDNTNVSLAFASSPAGSDTTWTGDGSLANPNVIAMGTADKATVAVTRDDISILDDVIFAATGVRPIVWYDYRYGKTLTVPGILDTWASPRYTGVGSLTAAGSLAPADDGTNIVFDGVDDAMSAPAVAALNLSVSSFTILAVIAAQSVAASRHNIHIQNGAAARRISLRTNATPNAAQGVSSDGAGTVTATSTTAMSSTVRAVGIGNRLSTRQVQIRTHGEATPGVTGTPSGTHPSENYQLIVGALTAAGGSPANPKIRAIIIIPAYASLADGASAWTAFVAWAQTHHGAA